MFDLFPVRDEGFQHSKPHFVSMTIEILKAKSCEVLVYWSAVKATGLRIAVHNRMAERNCPTQNTGRSRRDLIVVMQTEAPLRRPGFDWLILKFYISSSSVRGLGKVATVCWERERGGLWIPLNLLKYVLVHQTFRQSVSSWCCHQMRWLRD